MKAKLTLHSGNHPRLNCPVTAKIKIDSQTESQGLCLRNAKTGMEVDHQASAQDGLLRVSWIIDELPANQIVEYELSDSAPGNTSPAVSITDSRDTLSFSISGEPFTTYNYHGNVVRPYFYPVFAAPDTGITRNWPMSPDAPDETDDHPHHKGLYTAQGEVNGIDNWSEVEGHGKQVHKDFLDLFEGEVCAGFLESLDWTDGEGVPNLAEERGITIYKMPAGIRLLDYEVKLTAKYGAVTFGDTKEAGLLSVRVATSMDAERSNGGVILNSYGGSGESETWGKRAQWCDYSGPVNGKWYGICMMDHPENPRHPTYWHVRDYGLMTANCFGVHDFTQDPNRRRDLNIPDGESLRWRYRVIIHRGPGELSWLTARYHDYINPPTVEATF